MNFTLKINDIQTIYEIKGYWSSDDYIKLLDELDFADAAGSDPSELRDLVEMALSDLEPSKAAETLIRYKLKDILSENQIRTLSCEMEADNESGDNSDISLHYPLFNINQLLYSAFKGRFPRAKATKIDINLIFKGDSKIAVTKELVLKALSSAIDERSTLKRLFEDQLSGKERFKDAEKVIWELHNNGENDYTITTSDSWINKKNVTRLECSGSVKKFEDKGKD